MCARHGEYHFILPDLFKRKSSLRILEPDESDFDFAIEHLVNHARRVADSQDGLNPRMFLNEASKLLRQQVFTGNVAAADPQLTAQATVKAFDQIGRAHV